jgi:hypothetical protein
MNLVHRTNYVFISVDKNRHFLHAISQAGLHIPVCCFAGTVRCSCLLLRWNCSLFLFAASLELFLFAASLFLFADICDAVSVCDATPLNNESVADPQKIHHSLRK